MPRTTGPTRDLDARLARVWLLALAVAVVGVSTPGQAAAGDAFYLTPASDRPPREVVLDYLRAIAASAGLAPADLADLVVTDEYRTAHNGVTHLHLRQRWNGIEVENSSLNANVDRAGRLFGLGGSLFAQLSSRAPAATPRLWVDEAIRAAARDRGLPVPALIELEEFEGGAALESAWSAPELSRDVIPAGLKYYAVSPEQVRLVWDLVIRPVRGSSWWNLWVDAETGEVVALSDWTDHASYRVFALPKESPYDGARSDEIDPHDGLASPFGWHDTNGVSGAEFTDTRGNNVEAHTDIDANNSPDPGSRPDGGASLVFEPPLDLATQEPAAYRPAAVVNLFYWNNVMHDLLYRYGFDEPAGNFQQNNYGRGGTQGDPVQADAQDGSGTNNANFSTPPDGSDPRMQMFVWIGPPVLTVNSPPAIAGDYGAASAAFGPPITSGGTTGDVVLVNDGVGSTSDGCCQTAAPFTPCGTGTIPGLAGKVAILDRGTCQFGTKVKGAENNGAIAVIVVNNVAGPPGSMGAGDHGATVTIPSLQVSLADGNAIKAQLPGVNATLKKLTRDRDSDLDAGVIAHEYGHGLSNRLTGGPAQVNCLNNQEQAGEGWSDWMTLFINSQPSDDSRTRRPVGTYLTFEDPVAGGGIRPFPYTIDMTVNPHTYDSIKTAAIPHGVGSVWAAMLWEMYWELVFAYGYDPDLYDGSGGNNLAFQLVIDGMKLQPCSPSFVDARNAILQADQVGFGAANRCRIWRAFAKRGLGFSATAGSSDNVLDGVQAFDLPATCQGELFSDGFEVGRTEHWSETETQ